MTMRGFLELFKLALEGVAQKVGYNRASKSLWTTSAPTGYQYHRGSPTPPTFKQEHQVGTFLPKAGSEKVFYKRSFLRTRQIGANPEKSDLVNFRGPD